jgi:hypothetical protein
MDGHDKANSYNFRNYVNAPKAAKAIRVEIWKGP